MEILIQKSSWYFISKSQIDVFFYIKNKTKYRIDSKTARWGAVLLVIRNFVIAKIVFDIKNPFLDMKKFDPISLYQESIFWYKEMDFFKSNNEVLISNRFFISRKYRINSTATLHAFSRLFSSSPRPNPSTFNNVGMLIQHALWVSTTFKTIKFTGKQHVAVVIRFQMYMTI